MCDLRMFPEEKSVAPKAERKAAVSLNQLLSDETPKAASSGYAPWGSQAPVDPAVLAAMMVQAAMMKSSSPALPMASTMPTSMQAPSTMPTMPMFRPRYPYADAPAKVETLPPMRPPKPSIQAQRNSNATGSRDRTEAPPFVMLLENFCDRMLSER